MTPGRASIAGSVFVVAVLATGFGAGAAQPARPPEKSEIHARVWSDERPQADALVRWRRIGEREWSPNERTDDDGRLVVPDVDEGTYLFEVRHEGRTVSREVNTSAGRTTVDFDLSTVIEAPIEVAQRPVARLEAQEMESAPISWVTVLLSVLGAFAATLLAMMVRQPPRSHRRPQSVESLPTFASSSMPSKNAAHVHGGPDLRGELARDHPVWQELDRLRDRVTNLEIARGDGVEEAPGLSYEQSASAQYVPELVATTSVGRSVAPEPAAAGYRLFAEIPDDQGRFSIERVTPIRRGQSLYEICPAPDQRSASVTICQNPDVVPVAIENHKAFLLPVCEYVDQVPNHSHKRIDVTKTGTATRDDKGWLVKDKIHVRFS